METREQMRQLIENRSMPITDSGCWAWLGGCDNHGHGRLKRGGKQLHAHRVSYEAYKGPITRGRWVLHKCDVRSCVNPDHLFLGTPLMNARDRMVKGRTRWHVETYNVAGHKSFYDRPVSVAAPLDGGEAKRIFDYSQETGVLSWRERADRDMTWNTRFAGKPAGSVGGNGHILIMMRGKLMRAHRIIWLWMTGAWPASQVDHINRVRGDNRWSNLRAATVQQNSINRGLYPENVSGTAGVTWDKRTKSWYAKITVSGHQMALGFFKELSAAVDARKAAEQAHYGEFAPAHERVN